MSTLVRLSSGHLCPSERRRLSIASASSRPQICSMEKIPIDHARASEIPQTDSQQLRSQVAGSILAQMLDHADYSASDARAQLDFFHTHVAAWLDPPNSPAVLATGQWKSFMTDDGTPIELSWAWKPGRMLPSVRYSFEPVGAVSGSARDPFNAVAPSEFATRFQEIEAGKGQRLDWGFYEKLRELFVGPSDDEKSAMTTTTTTSQIFFAFDLDGVERMPKAYFMPHARASEIGCTEREMIVRGLELLDIPRGHLVALEGYLNTEIAGAKPAAEMLAIDILPAGKSARAKVYSRIHTTDFEGVWDAMMLGGRGRIGGEAEQAAKGKLRKIWESVLGLGLGLDAERGCGGLNGEPGEHRTGGVLLYHGIRPESSAAVESKVYIPVRHYAKSDLQVARAVQSALELHGQCLQNGLGYSEALQSLWYVMWSPDIQRRHRLTMDSNSGELDMGLGFQTYIAVSLTDGQPSITTYLKPRTALPKV